MTQRTYLRLTADIKAKIRELVHILETFLPLNTHQGKGVSFTSIFAESGVESYLVGSNKFEALCKVWEKISRKHPKLPYKLIRKIIPAAIEYRRYKRNPLCKIEIDKLSQVLFELGCDMRKELSAIKIDESVPEIKVPPNDLERIRSVWTLWANL